MTNADPQELGMLSKLVIGLTAFLVVAGLIWHGLSGRSILRLFHDLAARPGGPMTFRFILQPVMAAIAAIRDGRDDARSGREPYLATMVRSRQERMALFSERLLLYAC